MIFSMKRISNWAAVSLIALCSCSQDFTVPDATEEIRKNAENIFGLIDPEQDWRTVTSGKVSITADADMSDIAKVQILTESPFFNGDPKILAEAEVSSGQTVTLNYDAPRGYEKLIAACVDSKGHHFIKSFDLNATEVSFGTTANARRLATRSDNTIDVSNLKLDATSAQRTLNAYRNIFANLTNQTGETYMQNASQNNNIYIWADTKWENEMIWKLSSTSSANGTWNVVNGTIVRATGPIDASEVTELQAIFNNFIPNKSGVTYKKQHNNLKNISESSAVRFFNNHLTSDGSPIIITPVQMSSTDMKYCELYYYYYNPDNMPEGMTETEYVKQLPKFKAMQCQYTKDASNITNEADFFKVHQYLLPYYGDQSLLKSGECTTDGKVYRIRNGATYKSSSFYLTSYPNKVGYYDDKMATRYDDDATNISNQLWQIFTTDDGKTVLYNIGSGKCLIKAYDFLSSNETWGTFLTDYMPAVKENSFISDETNNVCHFWLSNDKTQALGSNVGKHNLRVATNKTASANGAQIDWYLEEYGGNQNINKLTSLTLEGAPETNNTAISASMPKGYRVGFMMRKINVPREGKTFQAYINTVNNGCTYGYGELNSVINNFPGHFGDSKKYYFMDDKSPRIAMFNANNKTYLAFEDGNDSNFSDMIIEVEGNSGKMFDDVYEVKDMAYTMCFEDRPNIADYDMNDVVLRCVRLSPTQLQLTLIATGANDQVYLNGIAGNCISGTDLNDKEVHALFNVSTSTFVNTQPSATAVPCVSAVYEVSEATRIPQFLDDIYIKNYSMAGNEIHVPQKGEPPFALIIPGDFDYPAERISIIDAYSAFRTWANNAYNYGAWLESYDSSKLYVNPYNK